MRKRFPYTYLFIFFALLSLMSLPRNSTEVLRGTTVAFLAPTWQQLLAIPGFFSTNSEHDDNKLAEDFQKLRLENTLLRSEISHLKDVMQHELKILSQISNTTNSTEVKESVSAFKKRHRLELQKLLHLQFQAIPAKVIFRSPSSWSSSLWIDIGTHTNETLGTTVVAKNSPVLVGSSVVGVIDYAGKKQSRVRLITDSGLTPSVRAFRESSQNHLINEKIFSLIQLLEKQKNTPNKIENLDNLITTLEKFCQTLSEEGQALYLAKGELHGASKPLWRTNRHQLQGIGFNYDFADGEGPARDLRTGKPTNPDNKESAIPILKVGDLLVTTGLDGVFPPNLLVAQVTTIHMLKEGDYYYELDALPTAGNFDDLTSVFVIPPVNFDLDEQPPPFGWE